jgi:DNA polymerase III alpha subunit
MDICNLYLTNPTRVLNGVLTEIPLKFDESLELTNLPGTKQYLPRTESFTDHFDRNNQDNWFMPDSYKTLDIAKFVLEQCTNDAELQRAGQELIMYQDRNMFDLLIYLKYLVDTMRKHNVVWGVGRGSSVASFVLFLIGIHRINSLFYEIPIEEFLK